MNKFGIILINVVLTTIVVLVILKTPFFKEEGGSGIVTTLDTTAPFVQDDEAVETVTAAATEDGVAVPVLEPTPAPEPEIVWEEGENLYEGETPDTSKALTVETEYGVIPTLLFCKPNVKNWGMLVVYLDKVDDKNIRYKRLTNISPDLAPAITFDADGAFVENIDNFPPSDCMERNIIQPSSEEQTVIEAAAEDISE